MSAMLPPDAIAIRERTLSLLGRLHAQVDRLGAGSSATQAVDDVLAALDVLPAVLVAGDSDMGRTRCVDALLGTRFPRKAPAAVGDRLTVLVHGEAPREHQASEDLLERTLPVALLESVRIIFGPGSDRILARHQHTLSRLLRRTDLVVLVASSDGPLTESDRTLLERLDACGYDRLLVALDQPADANGTRTVPERVIELVRSDSRGLLGFDPAVIPFGPAPGAASAGPGSGATAAGASDSSDTGALREAVVDRLYASGRIGSRLRVPLDAGLRILEESRLARDNLGTAVERDEETVRDFNDRLARLEQENRHACRFELSEFDALYRKTAERGAQFLESGVRLGGLHLLRDREGFEKAFADAVIEVAEEGVERLPARAVNALDGRTATLWGWIEGTFIRRAHDETSGTRSEGIGLERDAVLERIRADMGQQREKGTEESHRALENVRRALAGALSGNVARSSQIGDHMSLRLRQEVRLATETVFAHGGTALWRLPLLPGRRRAAVATFHLRMEELRSELQRALGDALDAEFSARSDRIREAVDPFVQFVEGLRTTLDATTNESTRLERHLSALVTRVEQEFGTLP